ncbi:hypothetical protein CU098_003041, partial [Rhizopus stolonifer]
SKKPKACLFVGDRDLGISSKIKEYRRYESRNYLGAQVLYASQTIHPVNRSDKGTRTLKGAFDRLNKDCIFLKNNKGATSRDRLSALWQLVFQYYTENDFKQFLNRRVREADNSSATINMDVGGTL